MSENSTFLLIRELQFCSRYERLFGNPKFLLCSLKAVKFFLVMKASFAGKVRVFCSLPSNVSSGYVAELCLFAWQNFTTAHNAWYYVHVGNSWQSTKPTSYTYNIACEAKMVFAWNSKLIKMLLVYQRNTATFSITFNFTWRLENLSETFKMKLVVPWGHRN